MEFLVADILASGGKIAGRAEGEWACVMDKGTYDAICLSDERREGRSLGELYPGKVARLLEKGGVLLITSCESLRRAGGGRGARRERC